MLNEGYALYKSLEKCGIVEAKSFTRRHPDIKRPGRRDGIIVGLSGDGSVSRIEFRKGDDLSKLWTTAKGNHDSFPVIKLQRPVWKIAKDHPIRKKLDRLKKTEENEKREILFKLTDKLNIAESEVHLWKRLHERVKDLRDLFHSSDDSYEALYELTTRFLLVHEFGNFLEGLVNELKSSQNEFPYRILESILIGNKEDKKKKEYRAEVPLVFDVADWEKYSVRVASPKMEPFVSECLFETQSSLSVDKNRLDGTNQASALSNKIIPLVDSKFPNPNLRLFTSYLFSVNKDTPCQSRYGKTSTEIIPIGRDEANAIQDSLVWITAEERRGKTWYPVPGIRDGETDLLIAYLENKPDDMINKAHMLGGQTKNAFSESTYEAIASVAIHALEGMEVLKANDLIRLFSLRKPDPGRTQVSLQRAYTIEELVRADKEWRQAAKNIPCISMPFFRKEIERASAKEKDIPLQASNLLADKGMKVAFLSPRCPFPPDLVRVTQKQWIRFGQETKGKNQRENSSTPGASLGDVYDVFFAERGSDRGFTRALLTLTLQRTWVLLVGLGGAEHNNSAGKFSEAARFTGLTAASAFGIYLYKLGIKKEDYMKGTFFNVGRFLSLVDTLHYEYCDKVRGGSIPPQLLGNTHLPIALDNPISALDMLSRRIGIYQAWTRKEKGDQVKLARWAVAQIGKVSDSLGDRPLPDATTSEDRAQILLGYLSRPEKKAENGPESSEEVAFENK